MPVAGTHDPGAHTSTKEEAPTKEIFIEEADDQSGPVDADITYLAEQRAMHMVLYQTLAVRHLAQTNSDSAEAPTAQQLRLGATAKHCIVLHGQSSFLSGHSNRSDFDKECYTRANVAFSRGTDLTVLACPLNMHGLEGATQVIAALPHGACTLHTNNTASGVARVTGTFAIGQPDVQAETAAFLNATELHPLWEGRTPCAWLNIVKEG